MRKVVLQMCVTADGFADGEVRIVPEFDSPYWNELEEELARTGAASVDAILLGRGTYDDFAGYWPKVKDAHFLNDTPKIVFSTTLTKPAWKPVRVIRGDLTEEIEVLKRLPGKNLFVPGGVRFPRALIERGLIDEYLLTVVPMILGQGKDRLFPDLPVPQRLKLVRSRAFSNGAVFQHYQPVRK